MPFYPIKYLERRWRPDRRRGARYTKIGEVFYDSQCQCVPMWNDLHPPSRTSIDPEGCCSQESYPGPHLLHESRAIAA